MNKFEEIIEKIKKNKFLLVLTILTVLFVVFMIFKKILGGGSNDTKNIGDSGSMIYSPQATSGAGSSDSGVSYAGGEASTSSPLEVVTSILAENQKINKVIAETATTTNAIQSKTIEKISPRDSITNIQNSIINLKNQYANAKTEDDRIRIHTQANALRSTAENIAKSNGLNVSKKDTGQGYSETVIDGVQL